MLAWDTHLPNGCFGRQASQSTRRIVEQDHRSGRTPIYFRPPPNSRCFTCRLPTTWRSSWRRSIYRQILRPFHWVGNLSASGYADTGGDPSTAASSIGYIQVCIHVRNFGYPRTGRTNGVATSYFVQDGDLHYSRRLPTLYESSWRRSSSRVDLARSTGLA